MGIFFINIFKKLIFGIIGKATKVIFMRNYNYIANQHSIIIFVIVKNKL